MTGTKRIALITALLLGALVVLGIALGRPARVLASASPAGPSLTGAASALPQGANDSCLGCHGQPGKTVTLANGETLPITIDPGHYNASIHGSKDITCQTCHTDITDYPHPALKAENARQVAIQMSATCEKCHQDKAQMATDSVHAQALKSGNESAATCSDCHDPHTQPQIIDPATKQLLPAGWKTIPQTCAKCHNAIYEEYKGSVHGAALVDDHNADVPTCTDCHGSHTIADPTTAAFRLNSPQLCAACHTDAKRMAKYGLSTQVLSTYVSDFHGTTVSLFQKNSPDQATNKPVCFDCHGVHNIVKVDDPQKGLALRQNIQATCQKCHPDASANFPASWLSHYIPSPQKTPLVYYVQLAYKILIPTVIGGMVLYVITDFIRRRVDRRKGVTA